MGNKDYLPKDNYTISFWLSEQTEFSRFRSTENIPKEVDTLIIGSGYAGTSTAYHLLEQDPNADVAVFEARNLCSGATGRNGGHVKPYIHRYYDLYTELIGEEGAAEIANSEYEHLWLLKDLVDEHKIDCDFFLTRACDVYPYKDDPRLVRDMKCYDRFMKSPYIREDLKKQVQVYYGDAARTISKNPNTEVAVTYPAASCWPWKLMMALLKKCVDKGLNLQANTMVTEATQRSDGKWVVKTADRGETICNKLVFATNGYTKALLSEFSNTIVPQKGVICRIVAKDKSTVPHLTNTYGLFTSLLKSDYLINRPDGSIVVGGQDDTMLDLSKSGEAALSEHFDCVDDSFVQEKAVEVWNDNYMQERFTTWKNTPTEVSHVWSGVLGFTNDYLPYVGELDCIGKKGAYICAGFHGHGMPRVLLSGKAIATCIATGKGIQEIPYTCPTGYFVSKKRIEGKNIHKEELLEYVKNKPTLLKARM